jgi:hypothetical protein
MLQNESVIPATSCKYIFALCIVQALEHKTAFIEIVVETAQWTDIYFPANVKRIEISHYGINVHEYRGTSVDQSRPLEDTSQFLECPFRIV